MKKLLGVHSRRSTGKGSKIVEVSREAGINGKPTLCAEYVGNLREAGCRGKRSR